MIDPRLDVLRAALRDSVRDQLKDLDRRAEAVESRERELNLLRARVTQLAAEQSFIAESAGMQQVLEYAARVAALAQIARRTTSYSDSPSFHSSELTMS